MRETSVREAPGGENGHLGTPAEPPNPRASPEREPGALEEADELSHPTRDPLMRVLRTGLGASDAAVEASFLAVAVALFALSCFLLPLDRWPAPDRQDYFIRIALAPVVLAIEISVYLWLPRASHRMIEGIRANGILVEPENDRRFEGMVRAFVRRTYGWGTTAAAAVFGGVLSYEMVVQTFAARGALGVRWLTVLIVATVWFPFWYRVFLSLARLMGVLNFTDRLFRTFPVRVYPLHVDGAGGFSPFGRMFTASTALMTFLGMMAAGMINSIYYYGGQHLGAILARVDVLALFGIYVVFTPLICLRWVWLPHVAMCRARDTLMKSTCDRMAQLLEEDRAAEAFDETAYRGVTDAMEAVVRRKEIVCENTPVWPIPTRSARRLVTPVVIPLLTTTIPLIYDYFLAAK